MKNSGFTLIELSVVLALIGVILYGSMSLLVVGVQTAQVNSTVDTMDAIEKALLNFRVAFGRIPCPSDLTATASSANYGMEAANQGSCTGGSPAANFIAASGAAEGGIPTRALRLPNSYMYDGGGHKFRYAVNPTYTPVTAASTTACAATITVNDASGAARSTASIYALVSHGANGHGAYTPAGIVVNAKSTNADEQTNCHCDNTGAHTGGAGVLSPVTYVEKYPTEATAGNPLTIFDDIVTYKEAWQMMTPNLTGNSFSSPSVTPPANGTYTMGNVLTFTLTYASSVTVTGTPRLDLSALGSGNIGTGNVAYATYQSGSGTKTLTFSYTVQSTDSAPTSGLSLTSNIDLNGGTISGGIPCFIAPNLSGVLISPVVKVYVTDRNHNRIVILNTSGTFISQIGCASGACGGGSGNTQLNNPIKAAVDSNGNVWVSENNNGRIHEFDSNGNNVRTVTGSGSQTLSGPGGLAIDASNNIWVINPSSSSEQIEEFSNTGTYIGEVSAGACVSSPTTGKFQCNYGPEFLAIDTSGNVWVSDYSKYWMQQFNKSTYSYMAYIGIASAGSQSAHGIAIDSTNNIYVVDDINNYIRKYSVSTGNPVNSFAGGTQSYFSCANSPEDVAVDTNGNIWVADGGNNNIQEYSSGGVLIQTISTFNSGDTFSDPNGIFVK